MVQCSDIHPQALLAQVYFENVFCLKQQSERGVKVALGDTDGPETTQIVIYPRRNGHAINLCVGRISTTPPPPTIPRLPRPDDPIPRVPPLHLGKHSRVRELKRAHTSVELGNKGGNRQKIVDIDTATFKIPTIPSQGSGVSQAKVKVKAKHEDVFGTMDVQTKGKRKQTSPQNDPEIEQGNKVVRSILGLHVTWNLLVCNIACQANDRTVPHIRPSCSPSWFPFHRRLWSMSSHIKDAP